MNDADLLRIVVDHSPDALSCHTEAGAFVFASAAWARLLGCTVEELIGRTLEDLALPEDAAEVTRRREEAQRTLQATSIRYRASHRDLRTIWVETTLRAVPAEGLTEARLVGSSRDVSAQTIAEQEVKARLERAELAEEQRDNLTAMMPGLVWYGPISPDLSRYHLTYMSDYLVRVTGYSPREWIETPGFWRKILHPEDRERVLESAGKIWPDGIPMPAYRVFAKNGSTVWFQSYMRIQRDAAGVPVRMHGLTLDVTIFKETERAIAELLEQQTFLKQRIDEIISSVPGIVWETWLDEDDGGSLTQKKQRANFCSDHVKVLTGYTPEEWSAQPSAWITLMPPEDRERAREAAVRLIAAGGGSIQHRLLTKDQREIWLDNHMVIGKDAAGVRTWTRGVALDITDRKLAEQERERLQLQVELQAERLLELSTPLIPVSDKIMVMPLIGTIDPTCSDHIMTSLLLAALLLTRVSLRWRTVAVVALTAVLTIALALQLP
ncbi:MAG: PAS domain-containing protein, partial [Byssovorax sp.]